MPRHDFTQTTITKLGERVGLLCSRPDCRVATKGAHTEASKATNLGVASHIHAASPGGPRYDAAQTEDERVSIENGIWLCASCGALIDSDADRFPAPLLRLWKARAEFDAFDRIGKPLASGQPRGTPISGAALGLLKHLATEYVKARFPNHRVWTFNFPDETQASELRALGLIETMGTRDRDGFTWRFTDAGQRWVMNNQENDSVAD